MEGTSMDSSDYYYRQGDALYNNNVQTPLKDLPPSLGFGGSSSPFLESPQTVEKHVQFIHWSPSPDKSKTGQRPSASSLLLPSQFPPNGFAGLESSPPEAHRHSVPSIVAYDQDASPKPTQIKRVGRRGRPRKYDVKEDAPLQPLSNTHATSSQVRAMPRTNTVNDAMIPRRELGPGGLAPMPANIAAPMPSKRSSHHLYEASGSIVGEVSHPHASTRAYKPESSRKRARTMASPKDSHFMLYATNNTTTGVPLFSSKAFEVACNNQSNMKSAQANALRDVLAERDEKQHCFSTKGPRFNFSVNVGGQATIDMTTPLTPATPTRYSNASKASTSSSIAADSLSDEENSESEAEPLPLESGSVRTPPRFTSLGSSDAAAAFAKTLARSNDQGQGFMFLFPSVSTPDKHGQLTSFVPCTPRTPRMSMPFDENAFSMQMQTPPGAIYSYETPGAMYGTGMTPFMGSVRGLN